MDQRFERVRGQVAATLADDSALVIGKSLGSLAAGLVAERGLPAIWPTPLLRIPEVVEAVEVFIDTRVWPRRGSG
jgi:hypothetical protein